MTIRTPRRRKPRIEIIPLIDIMFFLLATFIMVSLSMTRNSGMQVALPAASTSEAQPPRDESVTLTVTEDGQVFFNKEKIALGQLPLKLQTFKTATKDPKVIVSGAADANFRAVVAVLDEARKIGIQKVGISTQKK